MIFEELSEKTLENALNMVSMGNISDFPVGRENGKVVLVFKKSKELNVIHTAMNGTYIAHSMESTSNGRKYLKLSVGDVLIPKGKRRGLYVLKGQFSSVDDKVKDTSGRSLTAKELVSKNQLLLIEPSSLMKKTSALYLIT